LGLANTPVLHYSITPTLCVFARRREPDFVVRQNFSVADPQRLDPALLTEGQGNEKTELNELGIREMPM
jgi:hypothetical protein